MTQPVHTSNEPSLTSGLSAERRAYRIGAQNHIVTTRHGGFIVNEQDFYLGNALLQYGECCEVEWQLLKQLIPVGTTVVDVGANIGTHTVPMARHVGVTGRVIAIEPQRIIHQYLCGNISLNNLPHVEAYHCGAGERTGVMSVPPVNYFAGTRNNFGGVSLQPEGNGEPVAIRMLDDIIGQRAVQLIKIDVEGMEAEVLRGAKKTIKRCRPILYVENDRVEKSEELIKLLQHYSYRLYWHNAPLFNPLNFFENAVNIYEGVRAINMLCLPGEVTLDMKHFQEVRDPREHPLHAFKR